MRFLRQIFRSIRGYSPEPQLARSAVLAGPDEHLARGEPRKTIVLVSCGKTKYHSATIAENLYQGDLFKKSLAYARSLKPDSIFILSAKHGLVQLSDWLEPYEVTLTKMGTAERKTWGQRVATQLGEHSDLRRDRFVILAGDAYRRHLTQHLTSFETPLEGLSFGRQLSWLGQRAHV